MAGPKAPIGLSPLSVLSTTWGIRYSLKGNPGRVNAAGFVTVPFHLVPGSITGAISEVLAKLPNQEAMLFLSTRNRLGPKSGRKARTVKLTARCSGPDRSRAIERNKSLRLSRTAGAKIAGIQVWIDIFPRASGSWASPILHSVGLRPSGAQ
jgi:hypothetical protein